MIMVGKTTAVALVALLAGLVAADTQLARVDMAEGWRRSLATDGACTTEEAACEIDNSCVTCVNTYLARSTECGLIEGSPCEDFQEGFCCTLEEEDENCEGDAPFLAYIECVIEELNPQCDSANIEFDECSGATNQSFSWGMPAVAGSAAVAGILAAAFDFLL